MPKHPPELIRQAAAWTLLLAIATTLPFCAKLAIAQELPKAPNAQLSALTPEPGYFTEPAIAINPSKPEQVVAVFQDNAHAAYSSDYGRTWQVAKGVAPPNYRVSGDVSVAFDNHGDVFISYMAFDKLGTFNYWAHGASRSGLFVRRSVDGGKTWDAEHSPVIEHPTEPNIPFEDKPYIVSDTSKSRYAGNLYVGWTRWTLTDSEIMLARSTDGGRTWSKPVQLNNKPGLPRDDNGAAEGFDGAVGPDSTLYAVWSQDNDIMLVTSRDGGSTFSRARPIIHTAPIMFAIDTLERANGFPQIAIDPRTRRLYVTWTDYRNGDLDVFCAISSDGGRSWSAPVRVNNDSIHNGADQFFQWLAVDPTDGSVSVLFYDRRGDPRNKKQVVVLARSANQGKSFDNYAWTQEPFEAGGVFFGDYSGIAAFGGRVYGIWTEKPVLEEAKEAKGKDSSDEQSTRRGTVIKVGTADFSASEKQGTR